MMRAIVFWQGAVLALSLVAGFPALAGMRQDVVEWQVDGAEYSGVLVYDDTPAAHHPGVAHDDPEAVRRPGVLHDETARGRPGVLMVPNWRGITPSAIRNAEAIAASGYVVLVADVYGKTIRPASNAEAAAAVRPLLADRALLRARAAAALDALRAQAGRVPVDPARIAAVGFCFGGTTVLELARAGLPLAAVISLHGGLATPLPAAGRITPSVLVLNGAADASVSADDLAAFGAEMTRAGADWQLVNFGGAVHCFAEADADSPPNCRYHPKAGPRAWRMLADFLREAFSVDGAALPDPVPNPDQ